MFTAETMTWKKQPYVHQEKTLAFHLAARNTLDLSEVGTGKTAPAVTAINQLVQQGKIERILIIAPKPVLRVWEEAIRDWSDLTFVTLLGTKQKRVKAFTSKPVNCYLINFEGLRVMFDYLHGNGKWEFAWDLILADEIHHLAHWDAQQTKLALKLAQVAKARKGLTGTLITSDLEDVWPISHFIDPNIFRTNFWGFRNRYMYDANAGKSWLKFPDWKPRPGAVEEVQAKLAPYVVRWTKEVVLPWLPPMLFEKRYVELSTEQAKAYVELTHRYVTELEGEEFAVPHVLSRVTKLLEVAGGFIYRDDEPAYRFKQSAKIVELKEVLKEIGDKQVVIWCAFREEMNMIAGAIPSTAFIHGDIPEEMRQALLDSFSCGDFQYLCINPACGGEGLTILAPYVIYFSRGWKLVERLQSLGRHHRPGAERYQSVTVIDLIAGGTVDERVLALLDAKKDLLETLTPATARELFQ